MMSEETIGHEPVDVDQDLVVDGYEEYVESALEARDRYNTKLGSLMALYGLKDEGEVLTGCLTKVNSRISGMYFVPFLPCKELQSCNTILAAHMLYPFLLCIFHLASKGVSFPR